MNIVVVITVIICCLNFYSLFINRPIQTTCVNWVWLYLLYLINNVLFAFCLFEQKCLLNLINITNSRVVITFAETIKSAVIWRSNFWTKFRRNKPFVCNHTLSLLSTVRMFVNTFSNMSHNISHEKMIKNGK